MDYGEFIRRKSQLGGDFGFAPLWMPETAFDFQKHLIEWATKKGRCEVIADCGLGKTLIQQTWAENVRRRTNKNVLILTPLAVGKQAVKEAAKFGIEAEISKDGKPAKNITVTNYERLHLFSPDDFIGVVCDESSILKHYTGATQKQVTRFICKLPYRLLCTATAAPNDYDELGTSSEALGYLTHSEMLQRYFRQLDDKGQKKEIRQQEFAERNADHFAKLAFRVAQTIGQWRLKHHAVDDFWRWVCSWARACRMPSDLGFSDKGFKLPPLEEIDHVVKPSTPPAGWLFTLPAFGLKEEKDERRRTIKERCELAAELVNHKRPAVVWCHFNEEGDLLEEMIKDSKQISGKTSDEEREELYDAFSGNELRVLVIKPKIGAWGLNWQHCNHSVSFATHSYEQHYQAARRFYRFGQKNKVRLDVIASEGEVRVLDNMRRKAEKASLMFTKLVYHMNNALHVNRTNSYTNQAEVPSWLVSNNS